MTTCPDCGGHLTIDTRAGVEVPHFVHTAPYPHLVLRTRAGIVAFCDACDFVIELTPKRNDR